MASDVLSFSDVLLSNRLIRSDQGKISETYFLLYKRHCMRIAKLAFMRHDNDM